MAFIYLTEQGSVLRREGQRLLVVKDDATLLDIPAEKVEGVLIFGNVQFTTQAVHLLFQEGIEMALFTRHGKLLGQLTSPATKNITLRQAQYAKNTDQSFVLSLSRTIVMGKLTNSLELVREFGHNHSEVSLEDEKTRFIDILNRVPSCPDLPSLLGLEGSGANSFFDAFGKMIRHSFHFNGRKKRPATDPVNALLSLGYTMIYNEISSLLDGMGFDPYLGFFHQSRYGHATLASDLMEEFRSPLVDRFTLNLVNNRVLKEDDFFFHQASGSTYLKDEARNRYFAEYERFVTRSMSEPGEAGVTDYRRLFRRQAERLKKTFSSDEPYRPYSYARE